MIEEVKKTKRYIIYRNSYCGIVHQFRIRRDNIAQILSLKTSLSVEVEEIGNILLKNSGLRVGQKGIYNGADYMTYIRTTLL